MKLRALRRQARIETPAPQSLATGGELAIPEGAEPVAPQLDHLFARTAAAPARHGREDPALPPAPGETQAAPRSEAELDTAARDGGPRPLLVDEAGAEVSVVILTLDEEANIADCLSSCAWCDDVHVLDSGSTDRTIEIAKEMRAQVWVHPFESYGAQRNWAVYNIPLKHEWVFHLDADERFTVRLVERVRSLLETNPTEAGFYVPNKLMFMGRWLKRSSGYPTYQMRLFHKDRMRFSDYGHGQREVAAGEVGRLDEPYRHHAFSKGITDWLSKHNRYSSLEAVQYLRQSSDAWSLRELFGSGRVKRRRAWKAFNYHLPLRPFLRWCYILFVLGGILEGRPGRTYARMMAIYEQMITLKLRELSRLPAPAHPDRPRAERPDALAIAAEAEVSDPPPEAAMAPGTNDPVGFA